MRFIGNMMICRNLLRNVVLSLKTKGNNQISYRAGACHCRQRSSEVPCSKPYGIASSVSCTRLAHHTTKGWKIAVRNRLNDDEGESLIEDFTACEEGPEAVPHSALMSYLQQCSSVQEQINLMCLKISLSKEDEENRKRFVDSLHNLLSPFFSNMRINLFGSSINGLGFKGCDCDVALDVHGKNFIDESEEVKKIAVRVQIPTVDDVESGRVLLEDVACLPPILLLRFARRVIRQYSQDIKEPILLIKARHPILRFYDVKYNLFCDFSCGDNSSLRNTRVIRFLACLDERVLSLIKILRYWGKHHGFIGDIDQFNSYGFSLLVVYFLQNTSPPVLPPISHLIEKSGYLVTGNVGDDELMLNDLKKFSPSENTQTVEELLKEFFFFYMYFDFSQVICPYSNSSIPKMELRRVSEPFEYSTIAIRDPFKMSFNVAHSAAEKFCRRFLRSVLEACKSYQESEIWAPAMDRCWGISFLLDSPVLENPKPEETDSMHTIEIPLETAALEKLLQRGLDIDSAKEMLFQKAAKIISDIFKYGLLFECKDLIGSSGVLTFKQTDVKSDLYHNLDFGKCEKSVTKIHCTAYHNVFSGRSNLRGLSVPHGVANSLLEKEHMISLNISQRKNEDKREALFSFQCECLELQKDVPTLLVFLTFPKDNYRPAVAVFLKEYLPRFVQHSL